MRQGFLFSLLRCSVNKSATGNMFKDCFPSFRCFSLRFDCSAQFGQRLLRTLQAAFGCLRRLQRIRQLLLQHRALRLQLLRFLLRLGQLLF